MASELFKDIDEFLNPKKLEYGVRVKYPTGEVEVYSPMDDFIADLTLISFNQDPPIKNDVRAISAKKVKLSDI